jgi:hypothetical protein
MLGGAHIKSLINANLANTSYQTTLTRVVNDIQANLTRRFTRERVLRNMLDAHFIINDNKKNRLASEFISKMTGQNVSRNTIKKFLNETNRNVVLTANGKYRVTEKSQGQRLGELNRYVFNGGNVRKAFLQNLNSSGTKLKNANFYLSQSSKYNVKNLNGGKKFVKFKNVPAPAPSVSKKNVNNSEKRLVKQVGRIVKRSVTTLKSAREMKKLRNNLEALKSGGQAALARVEANLAAAKQNAAEAKKKAAALQNSRNASHAAITAAARNAANQAAGLRSLLALAVSQGVATKTELNAAKAAEAQAKANANARQQEHAAATQQAANNAAAKLQQALNEKNIAHTANLQQKLAEAQAKANAAAAAQSAAHTEALATAHAARNAAIATFRKAQANKNSTTEQLQAAQTAAAEAAEAARQALNAAQQNSARQMMELRTKLVEHQSNLATAKEQLAAAQTAANTASAAGRNKAARNLEALKASYNARLIASKTQANAARRVLEAARTIAATAAEAARTTSLKNRNTAIAQKEAAERTLREAQKAAAAAVAATKPVTRGLALAVEHGIATTVKNRMRNENFTRKELMALKKSGGVPNNNENYKRALQRVKAEEEFARLYKDLMKVKSYAEPSSIYSYVGPNKSMAKLLPFLSETSKRKYNAVKNIGNITLLMGKMKSKFGKEQGNPNVVAAFKNAKKGWNDTTQHTANHIKKFEKLQKEYNKYYTVQGVPRYGSNHEWNLIRGNKRLVRILRPRIEVVMPNGKTYSRANIYKNNSGKIYALRKDPYMLYETNGMKGTRYQLVNPLVQIPKLNL